MKKFLSLLIIVFLFVFCGCSSRTTGSAPVPSASPPVEVSLEEVFGPNEATPGEERSLVVIISDLHLGDQRSIDNGYGWLIKNGGMLADFLNQMAIHPSVKELVIAGDMFDEWVVPMTYETFNGFGPDQEGESKFLDSIAAANPAVISAVNGIIASGVNVTYVPGNHDMLVTADDMNRLFPGISQKRDAPGMGAYSPEGMPEVVIEHAHRYDFYNAPDMISNRIPYSPENYTNNPDAILPPGFFVTKIATSHGVSAISAPELSSNAQSGELFLYWLSWQGLLAILHVTEDPDARIIKSGIDGYTADYAINDLAPQYVSPDIKEPLLYRNIGNNWPARQAGNLVNVPMDVYTGLINAYSLFCDLQAKTQYFSHESDTRIVVFGHTHHATLFYESNKNKQKCIYANSGTWIDGGNPSGTCVVIKTDAHLDGTVEDNVCVYQFTEKQSLLKLHEGAITK
jgi:UDP-2,3-diacylglucosamine pyrophosphatase LpxH